MPTRKSNSRPRLIFRNAASRAWFPHWFPESAPGSITPTCLAMIASIEIRVTRKRRQNAKTVQPKPSSGGCRLVQLSSRAVIVVILGAISEDVPISGETKTTIYSREVCSRGRVNGFSRHTWLRGGRTVNHEVPFTAVPIPNAREGLRAG